jgi:hypothetical protein
MRDAVLRIMSVDTTDGCRCLPRLRTEFENENEYGKSMHKISVSILIQLRGGEME